MTLLRPCPLPLLMAVTAGGYYAMFGLTTSSQRAPCLAYRPPQSALSSTKLLGPSSLLIYTVISDHLVIVITT